MSVSLTLFIQAGNDAEKLHGTLNLTLSPGEIQAVNYGDLRNNSLSGMKLKPLPGDPTDSYYCRVKERGDEVDAWLNHSETIDLNSGRLQKMESAKPF
jgi:hypothetical protein